MKQTKAQLLADLKLQKDAVKALGDKVNQLQSELDSQKRDTRYYEGKYEEASKNEEKRLQEQREQRRESAMDWDRIRDELIFLRNFVMMLTLPESAQKELDRKYGEDKYGRDPGMDTAMPGRPYLGRR